jgi:hypothetical protein
MIELTLPPLARLSLKALATSRPAGPPEAWNGAVVRFGREAGVATPLHEFIYHSLLPQELQARSRLGHSAPDDGAPGGFVEVRPGAYRGPT